MVESRNREEVLSLSQESVFDQDLSDVESKSRKAQHYLSLTREEQDFVKSYNEHPKTMLACITKVSPTQDSIEKDRIGNIIKSFFESNLKGTYWIYTTGKRKYLFPEGNFKVNEYNYQSLETSFICYGNWQNEGSELKLLKPAIVTLSHQGGDKWELVDKGVIEFTSD
jgi:hypothetical protein